MEVVSPDDPERDLVLKRDDHARAGIPEYWIVDPSVCSVTVLVLEHDRYREQERRGGGEAGSVLLPGFSVNVDDLWRL
jgi:Uma2 family endonuclease